ncbi:MAG: sulfatase-like hydrolase/transferase, partial [Thermodesulfobacteriota bacterium]
FLERISPVFFDLYILYLHMVAPPGIAAGLPEIGFAWEGFGAKEDEDPEAIGTTRNSKEMYLEFVESIDKSDRPAFNFIHILLPHNPWRFYPSGAYYGGFGSGTRGIDGLVDHQWRGESWQITQNYQRYMLQVAFTDSLLGKLIERLKDIGLYEKSLIVVLADHGVSFRKDDQLRAVTDTNYPDIMSVPLFIKEPFNKGGAKVHDRNVETIDVLPTIADLLGIRVPWKTDGSSMLDKEIPEREKKVIFNGPWGGPDKSRRRREYGKKFDEKYAVADDKLSIFKDGLFKIGPYRAIVGLSPDSLPNGGRSTVRITMERSKENYASGDKRKIFKNGYITGRVSNLPASGAPVHLAVAVNNTIETVTRTVNRSGSEAAFSAILPDDALTNEEGEDKIQIFEIIGLDNSIALKATTRTTYSLSADSENKNPVIVVTDESGAIIKNFPIVHSAMLGRVDSIKRGASGQLYFRGWAGDIINHQKPSEIAVFYKDKFLLSTALTMDNTNEAELRGATAGSGFYIAIPGNMVTEGKSISGLRFFSISKKGKATELNYFYGIKGAPALEIRKGSKGVVLAMPNGEELPVSNALEGNLDSSRESGEDVIFSGWAYDKIRLEEPDWILLLSHGKAVRLVKTSYYVPELVKKTGLKGVLKSGFIFDIPKSVLGDQTDLRLFAISKNGVAAELGYYEGFKKNALTKE